MAFINNEHVNKIYTNTIISHQFKFLKITDKNYWKSYNI